MKSSTAAWYCLVVGVHITRNQRQVAIAFKNRLKAVYDLHRFVEALQKQQVIGKIVDRLAILRQLLDHLVSEIGRLRVVSAHRQVPLMLPHDLRILPHCLRRTREPLLGLGGVVCFECRIHRTGNNQRIVRRPLEGLLVTLLRFRKLTVLAIQITQSEVRRIVVGMLPGKFQEVAAGGLGVAHLA